MTTTTTAKAIALATLMVATSLTVAPAATAVDPSCTEDFDIADSESAATSRDLNPNADETGLEDAAASSGDEQVTIELLTNSDKLELGIFEDIDGCQRATHVSPTSCESDMTLDTTPANVKTDSVTCTIEAPDSGTRDFYFVVENLQGDELSYQAYVE